MILWLDAQLSPSLAPWLTKNFEVKAFSVKELGYRDATDEAIFAAARETTDTVVITKDRDFVHIVDRLKYSKMIRTVLSLSKSTLNMQAR